MLTWDIFLMMDRDLREKDIVLTPYPSILKKPTNLLSDARKGKFQLWDLQGKISILKYFVYQKELKWKNV